MKVFGLALTFLLLLLISACTSGGGIVPDDGAGDVVDLTAPTVESFYPDPDVDGEPESDDIQTYGIQVIFNEAMAPSSINASSFTVAEWDVGGTPVAGNIVYDAEIRTARFTPVSALAVSWVYVVTITTAVTDSAGNNLAADYSWTFKVAAVTPPGPV